MMKRSVARTMLRYVQIDEQLQLIVDDLRHDSRLPSSTRAQHQKAVTDDTEARRTNDCDERRRTGGKTKSCANDRRRTDSAVSSVDGANWQLKSTVSSAVNCPNTAVTCVSSSEGRDNRRKTVKQCNGHVATSVGDEHVRTGQASDEVKKRRAVQRHSHNDTPSHSSTDKKPVNNITTFHQRNSIRRCVVM